MTENTSPDTPDSNREQADHLLRQAIESEQALQQQRERVNKWYPYILVGVAVCATLIGILVFWLIGIPLDEAIPALIVTALVASVGFVLAIDKYCAHRVHKVHTLKLRAIEHQRKASRQESRPPPV
ncbi:MAG: ABC transporter permease [Proteobacteria bacterium]|jgi:hypothetical protein|nr:ABC transporter permease [Pseudomonadota bacterium]